MEEPKEPSSDDPNSGTADASSRANPAAPTIDEIAADEATAKRAERVAKGDETAKEAEEPAGESSEADASSEQQIAEAVEAGSLRQRPVGTEEAAVTGKPFVSGGFAAKLIAQFRREFAQLRAEGEASARRLRRFWLSRTRGPTYVPDPLAAARGELVDRFGRPLPWRWERSLSRDLLGRYGLMLAGAAAVIAVLARTIPTSPNAPVGIVERAIQKPPAQLPQTPPQAPSPTAPQAQVPTLPQAPPNAPQPQAPATPQQQQLDIRQRQQFAPTDRSSAPAAPSLPQPSKLGPQPPPSANTGKGPVAK